MTYNAQELTDHWYVKKIKDRHANDDNIDLDDHPKVSRSDHGAFVSAWLWVDDEQANT